MEYDIEGKELYVGARIAAAFRVRNQATLRLGTVIGFATRKRDGETVEIIQVHWDTTSGISGDERAQDKDSYIYNDIKRYVRID